MSTAHLDKADAEDNTTEAGYIETPRSGTAGTLRRVKGAVLELSASHDLPEGLKAQGRYGEDAASIQPQAPKKGEKTIKTTSVKEITSTHDLPKEG